MDISQGVFDISQHHLWEKTTRRSRIVVPSLESSGPWSLAQGDDDSAPWSFYPFCQRDLKIKKSSSKFLKVGEVFENSTSFGLIT